MAKSTISFFEALGGLAAMVIALATGSLIAAYVGITLYKWFMIPVGFPALSVGQLYGAIFFVKFLLYRDSEAKEDEDSLGAKLGKAILKSMLNGALYIGMGAAIHAIIY